MSNTFKSATYYVDTDSTPHPIRVKTSPNRNARRLSRRLSNRLGAFHAVMYRDTGKRTVYVPARGEGFTVKREAERFAKKHNGTVYRVANV